MFNKFIKRSRKASKTDGQEAACETSGTRNSVLVLTSKVTVNNASQSISGGSTVTYAQQLCGDAVSFAPTNCIIEALPLLKDVPAADRDNLFLQKLQICCFLFDFSDSSKAIREKEIKRQTLGELVDFIQLGLGKMSETMQEKLIRMISVNIFRSLPPSFYHNTLANNTDPEEDDPYLDPSWPHLWIVYELLLRYIVSSDIDSKVAKRYINNSFVIKLLDLFDSEDPREREFLKTILHRIYGKFMVHRPYIRKAINNIFYRYIFETERHCGISELLEILGSIINGFALPMKEEHKLFLVRALIPLHKPKSISLYHQQLLYCIVQFVEKDYKLADTVIRGLLKYWPVTNCQKEILFLGELEEVLEATKSAEFQRCMVPLFRQIGRSLSSSHFQVAERALFFWNNAQIVSLISENRNVIFPIVFEALEKNIGGHWNKAIHGLSSNVQRMFIDMDNELFQDCQRQYLEKEAMVQELDKQRALMWRKLEAVATQATADDMVIVN